MECAYAITLGDSEINTLVEVMITKMREAALVEQIRKSHVDQERIQYSKQLRKARMEALFMFYSETWKFMGLIRT